MAASAYRALVSLLVPPRCAVCAAPCAGARPLCAACDDALASAPPGSAVRAGIGPVHWAAPYQGAARELITALKFAGRLALADRAAARIAAVLPALDAATAVVPVPPSALRLRRRGFDPAALIAGSLARRLGLTLATPLRRSHGPRQVGRPRSARLSAPPRVRAAGSAPASALLVDDVLTTGATLRACAAALRGAGSRELRAAVFARALGSGPEAA